MSAETLAFSLDVIERARRTRNAEMAALMAGGGVTLEDVARVYGVSRERVRQIVNREGVTNRAANKHDPLAVLRAIRSGRSVSNWTRAARAARCNTYSAQQAVAGMGLTIAVTRLFRWRAIAAQRDRRAALVNAYGEKSLVLGRPLTAREILSLKPNPRKALGPGYVSKLRRLVGEQQSSQPRSFRAVRSPGELRATILHLAAHRNGCTVLSVAQRIPTSHDSIVQTCGLMCREGLIYNSVKPGGKRAAIYRLVAATPNGTET